MMASRKNFREARTNLSARLTVALPATVEAAVRMDRGMQALLSRMPVRMHCHRGVSSVLLILLLHYFSWKITQVRTLSRSSRMLHWPGATCAK